MEERDKVITVTEASKQKGVSRQAVYDAIRTNKIKGWRAGHIWLVDATTLDNWTLHGHNPKQERRAARARQGEAQE